METECPQFVQKNWLDVCVECVACAGCAKGDGAATLKFKPRICPATPLWPVSVSSGVFGKITQRSTRVCSRSVVSGPCLIPFASVKKKFGIDFCWVVGKNDKRRYLPEEGRIRQVYPSNVSLHATEVCAKTAHNADVLFGSVNTETATSQRQ